MAQKKKIPSQSGRKSSSAGSRQSKTTYSGKPLPPARLKDGRVPPGRTLSTHDQYLGKSKTGSTKKRPVVVLESNAKNDLAVVPLSSSAGRNRTKLVKYGDGRSYYKHYLEIEDDEGQPIRIGKKFRENGRELDVPEEYVVQISTKVLKKSQPADQNRKKMNKFRKK